MFFMLLIMFVTSVLSQIYVKFLYEMTAVADGELFPPQTFPTDEETGVSMFAVNMILYIVGIFGIKFNFLIFFYRLGSKITHYRIIWWVVAVFTAASGVIWIGILPYNCIFASFADQQAYCETPEAISHRRALPYILPCVLDVVSDAMSAYKLMQSPCSWSLHEERYPNSKKPLASHWLPDCHPLRSAAHDPKATDSFGHFLVDGVHDRHRHPPGSCRRLCLLLRHHRVESRVHLVLVLSSVLCL
jgi:hypothetical protein